MRKITEQATNAFRNNESFNSSNTTVTVNERDVALSLHGHIIALKNIKSGKIQISNKGWESNTTKERLNGVIAYCGNGNTDKISQKTGTWYWTDRNGTKKEFPFAAYTRIN